MGLYAFLAGILAVIITYFFGKREGTKTTETKIKGEVTITQQKAETAEAERDLAVQAAEIVSEPQSQEPGVQFTNVAEQIAEARATNDEESLKSIAAELARQMIERHQSK